jgi:hypothetical protein
MRNDEFPTTAAATLGSLALSFRMQRDMIEDEFE